MSRAFLNRISGRKRAWDAEDEAREPVPPPCKHPAGEDCPACGPATLRRPRIPEEAFRAEVARRLMAEGNTAAAHRVLDGFRDKPPVTSAGGTK